ncbi:MAG TPA: amidohydrolase family protein [Caulobacteraceae bacterium]|jgi:predicted TIM-barrel fold metal-dependent hydrolase|nr:amidohydrolase family protein [Caulobacteraceae bacterium]
MDEAILEPDLEICDPHHHLWDFPANRYLLPELLGDLTAGHNITSTVFVECGSFYRAAASEPMKYVGETEFVNGVAAMAASGRYGGVLACEGIVGRADLLGGSAVAEVLESHVRAGNGRFKGIRHAGAYDPSPDIRRGHTNPPPDLYGHAAFREGFAELGKLALSFEAWQYHPQLPEVAALADAFPHTLILLNHVGGPLGIGPYADHRAEVFETWRAGIRDLAQRPNVWVKLGGLGMTTCGFGFHRRDPRPGSAELAEAWRPWLETCIEAFGPKRGMFESNFPVDGASCDYPTLWNALKRVAAGASADEKAALFRDNARRFYRLD